MAAESKASVFPVSRCSRNGRTAFDPPGTASPASGSFIIERCYAHPGTGPSQSIVASGGYYERVK
jgi:hypothetical protein